MYMSSCKDHTRSVLLSSGIVSKTTVVINHTSTFQSEAGSFTGGYCLFLCPSVLKDGLTSISSSGVVQLTIQGIPKKNGTRINNYACMY